ncbi:MAG TPA: tRNA pseudouridine(38-40) synthase TruA [Candidatus Tumulicola sp.]
MTVEYDGSAFCGFQWQPELRTVAGTLETALGRLLSEPVSLTAAGRTDSGVHATGQVVSFQTTRTFPFERLTPALNSVLPSDVAIRAADIVDADFSARFSAVDRSYEYAIFNERARSPMLSRWAHLVPYGLDLDAMRAAAGHLLGRHDFRSFCGVPPENGNTVRTVQMLEIESHGRLVRLRIAADGFLHRMVRTVVGTLLEVGRGRREAAALPDVLAACRREAAGVCAPPHGLYLAGVRFRDGFDSYRRPAVLTGFAADR